MKTDHSLFAKAMSLAVHELRTPMTVVSGYLRMVLREHGGPLTATQRKMLEEADRASGRIAALVAEMSDLGKLEAGQTALARQPIDLTALVTELAADVHEGEDHGVRLQLRYTDRAVEVTGDRQRIGAALTAMMRAAIRERGEPGDIALECTVVAGPDREWAVVAVGDETTIEPLLRHARDTPPDLDEWRGGFGLALPIARRVLEAQGGALWAGGTQPFGGLAFRLPRRTQDT